MIKVTSYYIAYLQSLFCCQESFSRDNRQSKQTNKQTNKHTYISWSNGQNLQTQWWKVLHSSLCISHVICRDSVSTLCTDSIRSSEEVLLALESRKCCTTHSALSWAGCVPNQLTKLIIYNNKSMEGKRNESFVFNTKVHPLHLKVNAGFLYFFLLFCLLYTC